MEIRWKARRPSDHFYGIAVRDASSSERSLEFFRFNDADGSVSTIKKEVAKDWVRRGHSFRDTIRVNCLGIEEIAGLIKREHPQFRPQLVNIDIEQANYLASLSEFVEILDFPKLICMEWVSHGFDLCNYKDSLEFNILEKCGYKIRALIGGNIMAAYQDWFLSFSLKVKMVENI